MGCPITLVQFYETQLTKEYDREALQTQLLVSKATDNTSSSCTFATNLDGKLTTVEVENEARKKP